MGHHLKHKDEKSKYKARLVARWFEEENLNEIHKESSACCKENIHLSLAISTKWKIHSLDNKSTFWEVYLKLPSKAGTKKITKINHAISIYGLWDVLSLKSVLEKDGGNKSRFDVSHIQQWYASRFNLFICGWFC